jgi:hypothetical protein
MFTTLPKLFDKNLVVGFLMPVILGLIAIAWLFPELTILAPLRSLSANDESLGKLTYLILLSYGLGIILAMINTLQYRILEGYLPPISWLDISRSRHKRKRQELWAEYDNLRHQGKESDRPRADVLLRQLVTDYPPKTLPVMPTAFGNAIRAFEAYPVNAYGADAAPIWLRLAAVIPKDFADGLNDARAQVNFLLNLLYILLLIGVAALLRSALGVHWNLLWHALWSGDVTRWTADPVALAGAAAIALAWPIYSFAVTSAKAWGDVVKAAFDCFLPALIKQLGYAPPRSDAERQALWRELDALFGYWNAMDPNRYRLAD